MGGSCASVGLRSLAIACSCLYHDFRALRARRLDPTDDGACHARLGQRRQQTIHRLRRDGGKEAARCLWVIEQGACHLVHLANPASMWLDGGAVAACSTWYKATSGVSARARQQRNGSGEDMEGDAALLGHLPAMPEQPEAGDVGTGVQAGSER